MNPGFAEQGLLTAAQRDGLLELIDQRFGIRGSEYGAARMDAAIEKVLPRSGYDGVAELLASVDEVEDPRWLFELVEFLTVGETYFLRDSTQIAALRNTILPDAIKRRADDKRLRVWSAGCSTGEEVYTLAILLKEHNLPADWELTLLGTDVNRESLRIAREASYPAWSFRTTPTTVRTRYFDPLGSTWRVKESLRKMARFAWSNLGANPLMPPLAELDLIVCRNVTIYFDEDATQRLYRTLVRSLAVGGWLLLGSSDPLPADREGLERVDLPDAVLWRRRDPLAVAKPKTQPRTVVPLGGRTRPTRAETAIGEAAAAPSPPERPEPPQRPDQPEWRDELEAGLLALESGSSVTALDLLRRATFRDPSSAMAQFALARAYVALGDRARAHAALLQTRRLLAPLLSDDFLPVPGSDALAVATVRQAVQAYLEEVAA